jgi:hypothetical protein
MKSLMNRLYTNLTDGEEGFVERNAQERFIAWCLPGIPMDPSELRFLRQNFQGQGATEQDKATDTAQLIGQASRFARMIDFVPDVTGIFDEQQQLVAFSRNESCLSRIYERVLRQSQVAAIELTEAEKKFVEDTRNELYPEQEVFDDDTQTTVRTRAEGPALRAYKRFAAAWEEAVLKWNDVRIKSQAPATPQDALSGALNLKPLRARVTAALNDWEVGGQKSAIESRQAQLASITNRDLSLWKADLVDRFETSRLTDALGQEFFFATLVPTGFAFSNQGWSEFEMSEKDVETFSRLKSTQFDASGKVNWGLFSVGGGASGASSSKLEVQKASNVTLKYSVAQIPIVRPWFDPTFLESRAWRLAPSAVDLTFLSDGGDPKRDIPPKGMLVGYPTSVIFLKDVLINFDEMQDEKSELNKQLKTKASGGWGPLKLGGTYTRDGQVKEVKTSFSKDGFKVEGLQIIGFRCHLLNKSPNPLPGIAAFV